MNFKKILLTLTLLFSTMIVLGQGFSYTFTDPCTFKTKEIFINNPNGNVALIYNGQIQSFTQTQLLSGALEQWITQVNSSNPAGPCSGVGLYQNTTINAVITQNNIAVLTNVLSALNDISSIGGSNIGGIIEAKEKSNSEDNKKNNKGQTQGQNVSGGNTTVNGTPQGQPTNGQNNPNSGSSTINNQTNSNGTTNNNGGSTTTSGGNQANSQSQTNNGNNQNTGGGNTNQGTTTQTTGGNTTNTSNATQGGNQTNQSPVTTSGGNTNQGTTTSTTGGNTNQGTTTSTTGGNTNNNGNEKSNEDKMGEMNKTSSSNSAQVKSKTANAKQGGILLTGDIVAISSASGEEPQQFRINMSVTKSNTDNTFVKGALLNFTSSINNSNLTVFAGYRKKNFTSIIANSSMLNFEKDYFNTTSFMESYKYKKYTATLGINFTTGNLGRSKFQSLSALGGVIGTFKITPKINNTTMLVVVYSPFIYYYEGIWYQSGWLAVPFTAFDYKITQKFKLNLSFSGVQQVKDATLNYQVLLGAKALL